MSIDRDVIVVGAGPGGATAAFFMARAGLRVLLIDKSGFPRDKICGDAISGKSIEILREMDLIDRMDEADSLQTWGITFSSPAGDFASIPFTNDFSRVPPPGYVCRRESFDDMLVEAAREAGAELWLETSVQHLLKEQDRVVGVMAKKPNGESVEVHAPLVVGADGAYSVVARELGMAQLVEKHYVGAVRAYYTGVTGFHERDFIEIHFVEEAIPGYFWIFPLPNGAANVGVGMLSSEIKKRKVNLKSMLDEVIEHPRFKDRFAGAKREGAVRGWGLPVGSRPRKMAGDGWLLIGDAASLIDPFTGEGIGNAMLGGNRASEWALKAKTANDFSASFLQGFETEVIGLLRDELRLSHLMQRTFQWKWCLNILFRKAGRVPEIAEAVTCMFEDLGERKQLVSPSFYLRLLLA